MFSIFLASSCGEAGLAEAEDGLVVGLSFVGREYSVGCLGGVEGVLGE